jgi:hypothetical protein
VPAGLGSLGGASACGAPPRPTTESAHLGGGKGQESIGSAASLTGHVSSTDSQSEQSSEVAGSSLPEDASIDLSGTGRAVMRALR